MQYLSNVFLITALTFSAFAVKAEVQLYPWPDTALVSDKYSVKLSQDGTEYIPKSLYSEPNLEPSVYDNGGNGVTGLMQDRSMTYVPFAFTSTVEVEATKIYGTIATRVEITPKSYGIEPSFFDGRTVRFTLSHQHLPAYVSINFISADNQDPNQNSAVAVKNGLMLFGDLPETDIPDLTLPGVVNYVNATRAEIENADLIYFPTGDHLLTEKFAQVNGPGTDSRIFLQRNGQQIYLAPGAIVRGSIHSNGVDNVKISGRGLITGETFHWHYFQDPSKPKGKVAFLNFQGSHNCEFTGFIIVNPTHHTIPSGNNTVIKNMKIIGWASNHDGVRPGSNSTVEQVFIKSSDDLDYARSPHVFKDSVIWPMRNGALGQLGWNNLGTGFAVYDNIHIIHSEWDVSASVKRNTGVIGSVLEQGVNLQGNEITNLYGEWGMGMLSNITIKHETSGDPTPVNGSWGEIKDFTFKNILLEGKFQNTGGVTVRNAIAGFELDGAKATIHDFNFINVIAGNEIITNDNKDLYFDIDPNTTSNINFTTEGNIFSINASANAGGSLRPDGNIPTPEGMDRYISITPDAGFCIANVKVDGIDQGRRQNVFFENISADHTVEVTFANGDDYFAPGLVCQAGTTSSSSSSSSSCSSSSGSSSSGSSSSGSTSSSSSSSGGSSGGSTSSSSSSSSSSSGGDVTPPAVPSGLEVSEIHGRAVLNWNDNTEADFSHYIVRRSVDSGPFSGDISGGVSISGFIDSNVVVGSTYAYKIRAADTSGNLSAAGGAASVTITTEPKRRNVLFIAVDDLNDWVGAFGGHPQAQTPNIDALAARGIAFHNAYTASPVCQPSRTALFTGRRPHETGVDRNSINFRTDSEPWVQNLTTIPQYFTANGYRTESIGKLFHTPELSTGEFEVNAGKSSGQSIGDVIVEVDSRIRWSEGDEPIEETSDWGNAEYGAQFLSQTHNKPFFLGIGIFRPHLPWFAPKEFFDMQPSIEGITLPPYLPNDRDDTFANSNGKLQLVLSQGGEPLWQEMVRAYLANISYADAAVGHLLDALSSSQYADDTIVVLWGDHGWHLGEKDHIQKFTHWERSASTPLIIVDPAAGTTGDVVQTVSLQDLYPTLIKLAGLPDPEFIVRGRNLKPLIDEPSNSDWKGAAMMTYRGGNSIFSDRYHYINVGGGELYDLETDPNEWTNLVNDPNHADVLAEMQAALQDMIVNCNEDPFGNPGGSTCSGSSSGGSSSSGSSSSSSTSSSSSSGGGDVTPPAVPTGLVAVAGDGQVELSWDANTEADFLHYIVRRSINGGPFGGDIAGNSAVNSYIDTSVTNNNTYAYKIRAQDTSGNKSGAGNTAVAIPNALPIANAGPDQSIEATAELMPVTLDGSASTDPDETELSYLWTGDFGTATEINPTIELGLGVHTIVLTVDDGFGGTSSDEVIITVADTTPPTLTVPSDITVECNVNGGIESTDPQIDAFLSSAFAEDVLDPAPELIHDAPDFCALGTTEVTFTATDFSGNSTTGSAKIIVIDTSAPETTAALEPIKLPFGIKGWFRVSVSCVDVCDPDAALSAKLNGIAVNNGQIVRLTLSRYTRAFKFLGVLFLSAPSFQLEANCNDNSDNVSSASAIPDSSHLRQRFHWWDWGRGDD